MLKYYKTASYKYLYLYNVSINTCKYDSQKRLLTDKSKKIYLSIIF